MLAVETGASILVDVPVPHSVKLGRQSCCTFKRDQGWTMKLVLQPFKPDRTCHHSERSGQCSGPEF